LAHKENWRGAEVTCKVPRVSWDWIPKPKNGCLRIKNIDFSNLSLLGR